uniref:Uncharacterized protein n=1 Tax=Arundo donax TaxID=35708 RepID=A0A0A9FWS3_ARUDO
MFGYLNQGNHIDLSRNVFSKKNIQIWFPMMLLRHLMYLF